MTTLKGNSESFFPTTPKQTTFLVWRMAHKCAAVSMRTTWGVRVESSKCCYPRELVSFIRGKEFNFDPWQVTRSPPVGKRIIWVGMYNNVFFNSVEEFK